MKKQRIYLYSLYERIWHWVQAVIILLLLVTGLEIHSPERFGLLGFPAAVSVHTVMGFLLIANAFLALFYQLTTGKIREYLPQPRDFVTQAFQQVMYYTRGIFRGAPHPFERRPGHKLNPLQQVTYLAILNLLLPIQAVTGLLIWGLQRWPELAGALGGLPTLATVHTLVAWLFGAFIILHVYLTTTGHTPLSNIRTMVTGWEEVDGGEELAEGEATREQADATKEKRGKDREESMPREEKS